MRRKRKGACNAPKTQVRMQCAEIASAHAMRRKRKCASHAPKIARAHAMRRKRKGACNAPETAIRIASGLTGKRDEPKTESSACDAPKTEKK
jgi:hypothetical protein